MKKYFYCLFVLITVTSGSIISSGPMGLDPDMMVSDEVHDVPNPLQGVVEELTKNLTALTKAYESLCQEVFHLSRHVVFHEHALKHIAVAGHHHHHDVKSEHHHHHNHTASENEISISPVTDLPRNETESDDHHEESHHEETHHHEHDHNHVEGNGCQTSSSKSKCSILHEHLCHEGHHGDAVKPINEQFSDWFKNLVHVNHPRNENRTGHNHDEHHHDHEHHDQEHSYDHHSSGNATDANDHHHHHNRRHSNSFIDDMEESVREPEMIYATCEIIPNRHISLILQENVEGRINLWQQKDGNGPLFTHIKVKGLRVPGEFKTRVTRESNLMPVETPSNEANQPSSIISMERGFHVHVNGDLSRDCQSTGTHFNPSNKKHGGPMDEERHVGDLGNIRCDDKGSIDAEYTYPKVSLVGQNTVIGRSLVIHAQSDDLGKNKDDDSSIASGNSGAKIACCVIKQVEKLPLLEDSQSTIGAIQGVASRDPSSSDKESENN